MRGAFERVATVFVISVLRVPGAIEYGGDVTAGVDSGHVLHVFDW
jgi:hypothetical protein